MRKRSHLPAKNLGASHRADSLNIIAERWLANLRRNPETTRAENLYVGRSFLEGKTVARILGADLYIVSAGLGLVWQNEQVPNYNMSVTEGDGSLLPLLARLNATPSDWWRALHDAREASLPIEQLMKRSGTRVVLVALPAGYLGLISDELGDLDKDALKRLRIFSSQRGVANLSPHLRNCAMPYDERLEGATGYAGTRNDFPQRALRHFVEKLGAHTQSATAAARLVSASMAKLKKPVLPERSKRSDEEISSLISDNWTGCGGSSTKLLRFLRDDLLVACEQSRFRDLWRTVSAKQQTKVKTT